MQYRYDKHGEPISILGYGCMRFTKKGSRLDYDKAEREIMEAYRAGVNYYDTAYIYPGSEELVGEIVKKNGIRDKINIATKLPQYMIRNSKAIDKFFDEELSRLQTDHVDYYLMHHMTDIGQWESLKKHGILEWIDANKKNGRIRNIGFSYHGNSDNFIKILDAYDWDMCQIQYNYLDVDTQAGTRGLHAAAAKGIPVVIMEPLRGGKLVDMLPEATKRAIADSGCGYTPAELAFRWLWDQPEITCVLSGMNSVDMVQENCRVASEVKERSFTEEQFALIDRIRSMIESTTKVGCTGCGYCLPCPKGVKIPDIFRCYNRMYSENKGSGRFEYAQAVSMAKDPGFATSCVECGKCEQHCPQGIAIRQELKAADKALRPFPYNIAVDIARRFLLK